MAKKYLLPSHICALSLSSEFCVARLYIILIKAFRSIDIGNNAGTHDGRQWVDICDGDAVLIAYSSEAVTKRVTKPALIQTSFAARTNDLTSHQTRPIRVIDRSQWFDISSYPI